jgi:ADP-ribose pyrophosphatase
LEFPAGLVDNDNLFENANRELKEETGYTAEREIKLSAHDPLTVYGDSSLSSSNGKLVFVMINEDDEKNQNPK